MRPINLAIIAALLIALLPARGAGADLSRAQPAAICQARPTCTIGKSYDAGNSPNGAALSVVEVHLGLRDKPDDAPDSGCRADDKNDGGVEYWLLEGADPPKQLLQLCNDGYGSAGIGEDEITVQPDRLVHQQVGGSAWRWDSTVTFTLVPWRAIGERDCLFNDTSANNGSITDIDYRLMQARSVGKDASKSGDGVGCPEWPKMASRHFTPQPAPGVFGAYDVVLPVLPGDAASPAKVPPGTMIGDCAPAMTTAGDNGFIVFGGPAPAGKAADIKVLATSQNALLIQVFDPLAAAPAPTAGRSWVDLPHAEIWVGLSQEGIRTRLSARDLSQIGVDLNGQVHAGVGGGRMALPAVERWSARDGASRPVTVMRLSWRAEMPFLNGLAVAYSQAEQGRQTRLAATTGIIANRPLYLPDLISLPNVNVDPHPGNCRIRGGSLSISD